MEVYALPVDTMVWLGTVVTTDDSADALDEGDAVLKAERNSSLVGSTHG
ncbi:hypothetical protein [Streptomyces sp. NPDC127039]